MKLKQGAEHLIVDVGGHMVHVQGVATRKKKIASDVHVPADTNLEYVVIWNDQTVKRELVIHLDGEGEHADLLGVFWANGKHVVKLDSTVAHHAANTTGNCLIKGVVDDEAEAHLAGMIQIDGEANYSYNQLTERLMMLSDECRGTLQPELEILTNEVKASHATTIAKPSKEDAFYLQSRGLGQQETETMLVEGFLNEVVIEMGENEVVKEALERFGGQ